MSNEMSERVEEINATQTSPQLDTHEGAKAASAFSKVKRKRPKPRSEVWDHFTKFSNEQGEIKARCNYCDREFCADPKLNGTSSLKNHLKSCSKLPNAIGSGEATQTELVFSKEGDGSLDAWKFDQAAIRKGVAEMVIRDELPFKFVEGEGFRHCMYLACPRFHVPSRWTVARDCFQIYCDNKKELKQLMKSSSLRVSLTTDTWTSIQRINYMCLTAHYIDDNWKLNKKIINFCPISSHKGEAIGKAIERCLRDWGIDKVFTITVDNASSNDVAIAYLRKKFNVSRTSVVGGKYLHMRCIAHIINLIVNDGLKEMNESVARVRGAVRYVRQSPARLAKFKDCIANESIESKSLLCLDISTRWNSTYLMLNQAQKFERAFESFDDVDPFFKSELLLGEGVPDQNDWVNVRRLSVFLQKFYDLTVKVSGTSYVTSNSYLDDICNVYGSLKDWQLNPDIELSAMAKRMKDKYDKYWGHVEKMNLLLYIASILDPRKKVAFVDFCFLKMYSREQTIVMMKKVLEALGELFDEYRIMLQPQSEMVGESSHESPLNHKSSNQLGIEISNQSGAVMDEFRRYRMETGKEENKTELDKYLKEELETIKVGLDFDILNWWKVNSHRFPILSQLARDILAVPVSTVASESAFSTGGRVLDAYRSSLTPKLVQALICAQDWLRGSLQFNPSAYEDDVAAFDKIDIDLSKIALDPVLDQ